MSKGAPKHNQNASKTFWQCPECQHTWKSSKEQRQCPNCGQTRSLHFHDTKKASYKVRGVRFSDDNPAGHAWKDYLETHQMSAATFITQQMEDLS